MSGPAYGWVRQLRREQLGGISDSARLTLYELAEYADPYGRNVFPSIATLAEAREIAPRTVQRHLRDLEEAGLIVPGDQRLVQHLRSDRRPTVYNLAMFAEFTGVQEGRKRGRKVSNSAPERGDTDVAPSLERGDTNGRNGVTSSVTQSSTKPTYQSPSNVSTDVEPSAHYADAAKDVAGDTLGAGLRAALAEGRYSDWIKDHTAEEAQA